MENERNPWEVIEEEKATNTPQMIAKRQKKERQKSASAWVLGIVKWIVLIALVLGLPYAIFVHPVHKLNLSLFLGRSYEMRIETSGGIHSVDATVKVDGNLICIKEKSEKELYYEKDGETIYEWKEDADGNWKREKTTEDVLVIGSSSGSSFPLETLFDRRNYERGKGKFWVWHIKDGVDKGGFDEIEFHHLLTKYQIKGQKAYPSDGWFSYVYMTITIDRIGTTKITPPWEEK